MDLSYPQALSPHRYPTRAAEKAAHIRRVPVTRAHCKIKLTPTERVQQSDYIKLKETISSWIEAGNHRIFYDRTNWLVLTTRQTNELIKLLITYIPSDLKAFIQFKKETQTISIRDHETSSTRKRPIANPKQKEALQQTDAYRFILALKNQKLLRKRELTHAYPKLPPKDYALTPQSSTYLSVPPPLSRQEQSHKTVQKKGQVVQVKTRKHHSSKPSHPNTPKERHSKSTPPSSTRRTKQATPQKAHHSIHQSSCVTNTDHATTERLKKLGLDESVLNMTQYFRKQIRQVCDNGKVKFN